MKLPFEQRGTLVHDQDRFIFELLDGSHTSAAKPLEVGHPSWDTMMEYADFIIRACNSHDELLAACKIALKHLPGYVIGGQEERDRAIIIAAIAKAENTIDNRLQGVVNTRREHTNDSAI
jgi:hypothetical protein